MQFLSIWDILLPPFYIFFIIVVSQYIKHKKIGQNPAYKYYVWGIIAKIICSVAICLVYTLYYSSGDSTGYYEQAVAIVNLMFKNPSYFLDVVINGGSIQNYYYFDSSTGAVGIHTWVNDYHAMYITRLVSPICLLCFKSFITTTIVLGWICYSGIWKLYLLFCEQFPEIRKELAIALLFIPSVVFWGSGLLKDTVTLSAIGWYSYCFYKLLIRKQINFYHIAGVLLSAYLLVVLKPYILFALLPGSLVWLSYVWVSKIKVRVVKVLIAPGLIVAALSVGFYALTNLGNVLGEYTVDNVLERAVVVQKDLKREYYGGNSFDIGDFDATIGGVLSKAPLAINAALFRPYLWEVRNPLMLLSALESAYITVLTLTLIFKLKLTGFFGLIWKNPLLLFSVLFSLFFAFSVGLSTANFGALSRLKIPSIPFFVASLFVLKHLYEKKTNKKLKI